MVSDVTEDLKHGMKEHSDHYCNGSFSFDYESDDQSLGVTKYWTLTACVCVFDHNVRSSSTASVGKIRSEWHLSITDDDQKAEDEAAAPKVQNPAGFGPCRLHKGISSSSASRPLRTSQAE